MIELLRKIDQEGVVVEVVEGELKLFSPNTTIDSDLLSEIRMHKEELKTYLNKNQHAKIEEKKYFEIPLCDQADSYDLSNAQYRLWLASQTGDSPAAYNLPSSITLGGNYDIDCFQKAIHAVIERHEILRTVFKLDKDSGEVKQYILSTEALGFTIDHQDFRTMENPDEQLNAYLSADIVKPFDLVTGPLLRASLIQLSKDQYIFYYNMHHIISDGWSMNVLSKEVMAYYEAYVKGVTPSISPLRIQYKDYAAWQLAQVKSEAFQTHKEYWATQLSTQTTNLDLPTKNRRPQVKTFNGRRMVAKLSPAMTSKLRSFAIDNGGSLFMGLLAAWKILLYRYTGEKDITIGHPVTGRDHPDLENQIGFYVNTLALRNELNPTDSFLTFYNQIKENTLTAYQHQSYPFDKLQEDLNIQRSPGRNPLFDVLVDYHGVSEKGFHFETEDSILDLGAALIKFDLEFDPAEYAGGVNLEIGYNADLYEKEMIEHLILHYKTLLEVLLDDPQASIAQVNFLSNEEQDTLLNKFNTAQVDYAKDETIIDLFVAQVQKTPDAPALVFEEEVLSFKKLDQISNQLAHYLQAKGAGKDMLIPICVERPLDMIIGMLGVLKTGAAYVPIDTNCPQQRLDFILEDLACQQLLTHTELLDRFDESLEVLCMDQLEDSVKDYADTALGKVTQPEDLVYVIYTSGTTGVPKGVMVEHRNLMDYTSGLLQQLAIDQVFSYGLMSTPAADLGNTVLFTSLVTGGSLHTFSKDTLMNAYDLQSYFKQQKIDIIKIVPSHWLSLSTEDDLLLPQEAVIFGGEVLRNEVIEMIQDKSSTVKIVNHYGPTETTIGKLLHQVDPTQEYNQMPIGKPFSNSSIYILNEGKGLVPIGVAGELHIAGDGLARGYLNRPDLTAEKFIPHPFEQNERVYNTGDLARWLPDGKVEFIGRKDNQVKIRGYRIELEEIEAVLNDLYNIEQSAVLVKEDRNGAKQLVAYVVSKEYGDINSIKEGLMLVLEEKLPEYMVPGIYIKLEKMPLTANGKIDRKALPIPTSLLKQKEYIAPTTEMETQLATIWQDVLDVEKIGTSDDFFELGGNSLNAIKIISRVKKSMGLDIEIKSLFLFKTIRELAFQIDFSEQQEAIKSNNQTLRKIEL